MKLTRRQLSALINDHLVVEENKMILQEWKQDRQILNEFRFGKITKGVEFEMCDLSGIPSIFYTFLKLFREYRSGRTAEQKIKGIDRTIEALFDELKEASPDEALRISEKIKEFQEDRKELKTAKDASSSPGRWERVMATINTSETAELIGRGFNFAATALLGLNKVDCDRIVRMTRNFVRFFCPFFGIDPERVISTETGGKEDGPETKTRETNISVEKEAMLNTLSKNFQSQLIIDIDVRKEVYTIEKIRDAMRSGNIKSYHLDFFELFSPNEYSALHQNKDLTSEEKRIIKENIEHAIKELGRNSSDYQRLAGTFANVTPLLSVKDGDIKNVFKAMKWEDAFKDSVELSDFMSEKIKELKTFIKDSF
jgi:hypothetical protein